MMYAYYEETGMVVRTSDGQVVQPQVDPIATAEYQAWVAAGGIADVIKAPTPRVMSKLEFRRLFTMQERVTIDNASDNAALPAEVRAAMKTMLTDLALAEQVHLDDADIVYGVNFMAQVGLIAPERVAQILG